jgi:hypothetical protein
MEYIMYKSSIELRVAQVSKRGNKYAVVAGRAILAKFKTVEQAKKALEENARLYRYWAGSASVSIQNSTPVFIYLD